MRERPIIMSGGSVQKVLDLKKTQTRRPVTVHWHKGKRCAPYSPACVEEDGILYFVDEDGDYHKFVDSVGPYGKPGDTLWVKENFRFPIEFDDKSPSRVGELCLAAEFPSPWCATEYADGARDNWVKHTFGDPGRLRPSIHMPRWASRITLEITGVRVERVQVITIEDAIAEGIEPVECKHPDPEASRLGCTDCMNTGLLEDPRAEFAHLWDEINAARGYPWASNDWVWVIEFRYLHKEH